MANKKKGLRIELYPNGGEFGNILRNYGLAGADATLSTFGATNVVKDSDYRGDTAQDFAKAGNIMGGITKAALPIAAGAAGAAVGGPMGAKAGMGIAQGVQGVGSQFNPQDPNTQNTQQYPQPQQGMNPNQMMNMANTGMQIYNMGSQMGAFKYGGVQYAGGGEINAEVEKKENTLNPDGSTNQYNGPSHDNGGIQTHLDPKTLIFSDRLKLGKKTFADLNKPNNTEKEDKMLEDDKSSTIQKMTADLMKTVKNKNSEELFKQQESLKANNYKSQLEEDLFSCGGMMKYKNGGIHIKPANVGKFTSAAKRAGMGVQEYASHIMAHKNNYSSTLVKRANFAKNASHWKHEDGGVQMYPDGGYAGWAQERQAAGWKPLPANYPGNVPGKEQYYDPRYNITQDANNASGWKHTGPGVDPAFNSLPGDAVMGYQPATKQANVSFGKDPTWVPAEQTTYQGQPAGSFRNTTDADPNSRYVYAGGQYVKMAHGGMYPNGGTYSSDSNFSMYTPEDRAALMGNTPTMNDPSQGSPNWGGIAKQIGMGVAQNAGNIYDLNRSRNVETTKFQRANASQLDPTAALNYNMVQGKMLNEDIKNSSSGNASTYLQNRKDAAVNQMMSNAQIRQSYANQNAQINNNNSMFNTNIANQEEVANEQNRAQARNLKSSAYSNIGQNIMGQYRDNQMGNRDQDVMNMIYSQYPENKYNPGLQNYKQKKTSTFTK